MADAKPTPRTRHTCPQCGDVLAAENLDAVIEVIIEHARRFHDVYVPDLVPLDELRASIQRENEGYWAHVDRLPATAQLSTVFEAKLGEREREIVAFVVHGFSNKEIAKRLCISTRTVSTHLVNIYEKLNVHSRTALVALVRAADRSVAAGLQSADVSKVGPFVPIKPPKD